MIPIFYALAIYIHVCNWNIRITNQRIIETKGVFKKRTEEVELFRIKDISIVAPPILRIFGMASIVVLTSDNNLPILRIYAIKNAVKIKDEIRKYVDIRRVQKGVFERDVREGNKADVFKDLSSDKRN